MGNSFVALPLLEWEKKEANKRQVEAARIIGMSNVMLTPHEAQALEQENSSSSYYESSDDFREISPPSSSYPFPEQAEI